MRYDYSGSIVAVIAAIPVFRWGFDLSWGAVAAVVIAMAIAAATVRRRAASETAASEPDLAARAEAVRIALRKAEAYFSSFFTDGVPTALYTHPTEKYAVFWHTGELCSAITAVTTAFRIEEGFVTEAEAMYREEIAPAIELLREYVRVVEAELPSARPLVQATPERLRGIIEALTERRERWFHGKVVELATTMQAARASATV